MNKITAAVSGIALASVAMGGVVWVAWLRPQPQAAGTDRTGTMEFELQVPSEQITAARFRISGNGIQPIEQTVKIGKILRNASFNLALPVTPGAGPLYQIQAEAGERGECSGQTDFGVRSGGGTLNLFLHCSGLAQNDKADSADVNNDQCALVSSLMAVPRITSLGDEASLSVSSREANAQIAWSTTGRGTLIGRNSPRARFRCEADGTTTVNLTVTGQSCSSQHSLTISCVRPEQAHRSDGPAVAARDRNSQDPGSSARAKASNQRALKQESASAKPDSIHRIEALEEENQGQATGSIKRALQGPSTTGGPTLGSARALSKANARCPNNVASVGSTQACSSAYGANDCGQNCAPMTSDKCLSCERNFNDCVETSDCDYAKGEADDGPAAGTPRAVLCRQVVECLRDTNCGSEGNLPCYCGTSGPECFNGAANGPCKDMIEAGLETEEPMEVAKRFGTPTYGGAVALLRIAADYDHCRQDCFDPRVAK